MFRLTYTSTLLAIWERAIRLSKKCSPITWKALSLFSVFTLIISCVGLWRSNDEPQEFSRSIPPQKYWLISDWLISDGQTPITKDLALIKILKAEASTMEELKKFNFKREVRVQGFRFSEPPAPDRNLVIVGSYAALGQNIFTAAMHLKRPARNDMVQSTQAEGKAPYPPGLFWVSLCGMMVSSFTSITTLILTWISLHRRRAEEILMKLEVQKRQLEIEQLKIALEKARCEPSREATLLIIPG